MNLIRFQFVDQFTVNQAAIAAVEIPYGSLKSARARQLDLEEQPELTELEESELIELNGRLEMAEDIVLKLSSELHDSHYNKQPTVLELVDVVDTSVQPEVGGELWTDVCLISRASLYEWFKNHGKALRMIFAPATVVETQITEFEQIREAGPEGQTEAAELCFDLLALIDRLRGEIDRRVAGKPDSATASALEVWHGRLKEIASNASPEAKKMVTKLEQLEKVIAAQREKIEELEACNQDLKRQPQEATRTPEEGTKANATYPGRPAFGHSTKRLEAMYDAIETFWIDWDGNERTAPQQKKVQGFLIEKLRLKSDVSGNNRTASELATAIKPDCFD